MQNLQQKILTHSDPNGTFEVSCHKRLVFVANNLVKEENLQNYQPTFDRIHQLAAEQKTTSKWKIDNSDKSKNRKTYKRIKVQCDVTL